MSQPSLVNPGGDVPVQKQRMDVYTMMLIISLICIITACVVLYMELTRWGSYPWWDTSEANVSAVWPSTPGIQRLVDADSLA